MDSGPETPARRASAPNAPTPLRAALRRAWTARRRLATAAGGLLALYLAFGMLLLPGLVARRVEFLLEHELLALVRVGRAWVNPLTFRTWLEDIDIIEGGPHGGSRAARLRRVELDIDALATLLTAHPVLDRLLIQGARLRVEIDATGEMNWTRMARAAAREYAEWNGWPALRIGRAEVRDAVIELIDRSGPEPVQRLIAGEGHIGGLDTRAPARSTVQLMLSTHLGESARFTGTFSAAGHELDGRFALSHLRPAELMGYLSRVMDGRVTRGRAEARGTLTARVTPRGSPELRLRIERAGVGDLSIRQDAQEALSAAWIGTDGASLELAGGSRGFIITAPRCTAESVRVVTTRDPEGRLRLMDLFPTRRAVAAAGSDPPVPSPSRSPRERSDDPRRWIPAQLVRGVRDGLAGLRLSARIDGVEGVALILTDLGPGAWYAPPIDPGVGPGDPGRPRPVVHRLVAGEASALLNVSPESATIDFSLAGTYNAGTARLEGSASSHPPRARLTVALQGVDLATLRHYLPPSWVEGWPEAEVRRGQGGAEGRLTLNRLGDGALNLEWTGRLEAAGFRSVRSGDTRPQLDVARLRAVGPLTISLRGQDLALDWTIETDAERFDLDAPLIGETSGVRAALAAARGHLRVRSPAMGSILVGWQGQTTATGVEIRGQRPEPLQITARTFAADGGLDLSVSPDGAASAQWRGRAHGDALSLRTALGDVRELRGERVEAQGELRVHVPADDRYDIHLGGSAEIRGGLVNPPPPEGAQEAPPDTAPAEVRLAVAGLSARGTIDVHGGEAGGRALTMQGQAELQSATGSWPVRAEGAPSTAVEASAGRLESEGRLSVAADGLTLEGRSIGETLSVAHLGAGLRFQTARSDLRGGAGVRADGSIEARGGVLADHVHAGLDPERAASSAIAADLARWGGWTGGEVRISALSISDAALDTRRKELSARTISALAPSADLRVRIGTDRDAERSEGHSGPDPSPARAEDARADSWRLGVDLIEVNEARVTVRDPASTPPMQAELTDVKAAVRGLRIDPDAISRPDLAAVAPATLAASARVEQTGRGEVEATIDLASAHPRVEAQVRTSDVPLKPFEAYVGRYLGYLVTEGRLTLDMPVTIAQRRVEGTINAQLDRFYLGEATGSRDAPGVPVKLGLALLRDRQERIDVRIPFSGDLNSPTFSMGGVIWQAIVGLVVKTATAPFQILAAILNLGGETDLSRASFDPGTAELTGEGLRVTDLLARALRERPGLALEVAAQISPEHDLPAMRLQRLRREALEEHRQTAGAGASLDDAAFRQWVARRALPLLPPPAPPPPPSIHPPAPPTRAGAAAPPAEVPAADQPVATPGTPPSYEILLGLLLDRVVVSERDLEDLVNARIERAIAAIRAGLESPDAPNATPGTDVAPRVRRAAAGTTDGARGAGAAGAAAPCPCAVFELR
jgi:hypothetical protein